MGKRGQWGGGIPEYLNYLYQYCLLKAPGHTGLRLLLDWR